MLCPSCKGFDVGEAPWEEWERCPSCDTRPETALAMRNQRIIIERREQKIERQAKQITRLESSRKTLRQFNSILKGCINFLLRRELGVDIYTFPNGRIWDAKEGSWGAKK